ncbi:hypothetical protein ABK040_000736 [Willaertia magna]
MEIPNGSLTNGLISLSRIFHYLSRSIGNDLLFSKLNNLYSIQTNDTSMLSINHIKNYNIPIYINQLSPSLFNISSSSNTTSTLVFVDSILEYIGSGISLLTILFYLINIFLLFNYRKDFFHSFWPLRLALVMGALINNIFGGIFSLLIHQDWWVYIGQSSVNTALINTKVNEFPSIPNNIACRVVLPFEFIGFVSCCVFLAFLLMHHITTKKPNNNGSSTGSRATTKSNNSESVCTPYTPNGDIGIVDDRRKQNHSDIVDVVISDDMFGERVNTPSPEDINGTTPINSNIGGFTIDDGAVKNIPRSLSNAIPATNIVKKNVGMKKSSSTHQFNYGSAIRKNYYILSNGSFLEKINFRAIDRVSENCKIFTKSFSLIAVFSVFVCCTIVTDIIITSIRGHNDFDFIYAHVAHLSGYCTMPISSLSIYIVFYIMFLILFNLYCVRNYKTLINKRLRKRILSVQIITNTILVIFGILGRCVETLFTILQSIETEPSLFDAILRLFHVVDYICCDLFIGLIFVIYFVFLPWLDILTIRKYYLSQEMAVQRYRSSVKSEFDPIVIIPNKKIANESPNSV